ncbi:MAG: divalent cation tolerance protein CutA [Steroidobacterales bacterium]
MRLKSLHPYQVPEVIGFPITCVAADCLSWRRGAVQ